MTKKEFLQELKEVLAQELTLKETEYHIAYYKDYIESQIRGGSTEE
jgi:uncharacterized membrane protein